MRYKRCDVCNKRVKRIKIVWLSEEQGEILKTYLIEYNKLIGSNKRVKTLKCVCTYCDFDLDVYGHYKSMGMNK